MKTFRDKNRLFEIKENHQMTAKADAAMAKHKIDDFIVEVDGLQFLTQKGYEKAVSIKQLLSLLELGRIAEEKQ